MKTKRRFVTLFVYYFSLPGLLTVATNISLGVLVFLLGSSREQNAMLPLLLILTGIILTLLVGTAITVIALKRFKSVASSRSS